GTVASDAQSTVASVTQSTQATRSESAVTVWAHDGAPEGLMFGQFGAKPISSGVESSAPPQLLSGPPHALQIAATFFDSAFAISAAALPSAAGQTPAALPAPTARQHLASAADLAVKKVVAALPILRRHFLSGFCVGSGGSLGR